MDNQNLRVKNPGPPVAPNFRSGGYNRIAANRLCAGAHAAQRGRTWALATRFAELASQLEAVEATKRYEDSPNFPGERIDRIDNNLFLNWKVKARHLISMACGTDSEHYRQFVEGHDDDTTPHVYFAPKSVYMGVGCGTGPASRGCGPPHDPGYGLLFAAPFRPGSRCGDPWRGHSNKWSFEQVVRLKRTSGETQR